MWQMERCVTHLLAAVAGLHMYSCGHLERLCFTGKLLHTIMNMFMIQ